MSKQRVCLVLDDSASMAIIKNEVKTAFNRILKGIADDAKANKDDVKLSLLTFGERVDEHQAEFRGLLPRR